MSADGRKMDVLIYASGEHSLEVWADVPMRNCIAQVKGVMMVIASPFGHTLFYVRVDARYDLEFVRREIEAAILCAEVPA